MPERYVVFTCFSANARINVLALVPMPESRPLNFHPEKRIIVFEVVLLPAYLGIRI